MNSNLDVAHRVTAGQVADGVPGQEQDHFGLAGGVAQVAQGASLIGRKPVFQKVDVVRHSVPV